MRSIFSSGYRVIARALTVILLAGCATTNISPTSQPDTSSTFIEVTRTIERAFWSAAPLNPQALLKGAVHGIAPELRRRDGTIAYQGNEIVISLSGHTKAIDLSSVNSMTVFIEAFMDIQRFLLQSSNGQATAWEYRAIEGMINALDQYSAFIPPSVSRETPDEAQGNLGAIGIRMSVQDGELVIVKLIEGAPGFRAGLKEGDHLITIDGQSTQGLTLRDAVRLLRGPAGSRVVLRVRREGSSEPEEVPMIREQVALRFVEGRLLEGHIGYVKMWAFHEGTVQETEQALSGLTEQKLEGVLLDLRNNPGGMLNQAIKVCDLFVEEGLVVVSTEGRARNQNSRFVASGGRKYRNYPLIILINSGSAAGSEIIAGALQDLQQATIMGTKSRGQGSIQTIFPFRDGSALRLTTAYFFTPSGRNIDGVGIIPDIEVQNAGQEDRQLTMAHALMKAALAGTDRGQSPETRESAPISPNIIKEVARRMGLL